MFGKPLHEHQGIRCQFVEVQTDAELIGNTIYTTARLVDEFGKIALSGRVARVNTRSNQLAWRVADPAIEIHKGVGYIRQRSFEYIPTGTIGATASPRVLTSCSCAVSLARGVRLRCVPF